MAKKPVRVILDTNLWISYLISNAFLELDQLIVTEKVKLIFSLELLSEFLDVSTRPKLKKYFSRKDVIDLLESIDEYSEVVDVSTTVDVCRDKKDNFLLELAADGKADFLVTGDADLLSLKKFEQAVILTYRDFIKELQN